MHPSRASCAVAHLNRYCTRLCCKIQCFLHLIRPNGLGAPSCPNEPQMTIWMLPKWPYDAPSEIMYRPFMLKYIVRHATDFLGGFISVDVCGSSLSELNVKHLVVSATDQAILWCPRWNSVCVHPVARTVYKNICGCRWWNIQLSMSEAQIALNKCYGVPGGIEVWPPDHL